MLQWNGGGEGDRGWDWSGEVRWCELQRCGLDELLIQIRGAWGVSVLTVRVWRAVVDAGSSSNGVRRRRWGSVLMLEALHASKELWIRVFNEMSGLNE